MTFSLFSAVLLVTLGCTVYADVSKGMRRGGIITFLSLITRVVSLVISIIITPYLSRQVANASFDGIAKTLSLPTAGYTGFVIESLVSIIISSVLFLLTYSLLRIWFRIISSAIAGIKKKKHIAEDVFAGDNEAEYKRNSKRWGAVTGVICGIFTAVVFVSPLMGTLNSVKTAIKLIDRGDKKILADSSIKPEVDALKKYADDCVGSFIYYIGGDLIYRSAASTVADGNTVYLANELDTLERVMDDFLTVYPVLGHPEKTERKHIESIYRLCDGINDLKLVHILVADYLPELSRAWLKGEAYMSIKKPSLNEAIDPSFDSILEVCANTDSYSVKQDVTTLLRIYALLLESGILEMGNDFQAILDCIESTGLFERLEAELDKNPNMQSVKRSMSEIAMRVISDKLYSGALSDADLGKLASDLSDAITSVLSKGYGTKEEMRDALMMYADEYLSDFGFSVPVSLTGPMADLIITEMSGGGEISADRIQDFFMGYLNK